MLLPLHYARCCELSNIYGKALVYGHDLEGEEEEEFECNFPDDQCHQLLPWLNEKVAS